MEGLGISMVGREESPIRAFNGFASIKQEQEGLHQSVRHTLIFTHAIFSQINLTAVLPQISLQSFSPKS